MGVLLLIHVYNMLKYDRGYGQLLIIIISIAFIVNFALNWQILDTKNKIKLQLVKDKVAKYEVTKEGKPYLVLSDTIKYEYIKNFIEVIK